MIRRVFRGRSPYGLLRYLYGQGRRNEHADPHLVASWDGDPAALEPAWDDARDAPAVGPLTRLLEQPLRGCDRLPERWVYHLVLRNDPGDRRLTDDEWAQVCAAAMDRTGIAPADDSAGCRWVAVRHADDHVHLVATLAREDGRPPRLWNDYAQLAAVAYDFERTFGLRSTAGRDDHTAASRPGVKEQQAAERMGRQVAPRVELRRRVRLAAAASADFDEFTQRLAAERVTVWPRLSELHPGEVTGYSVSLDGHRNGAGQPVRFGGGKLAPDLSWPKLCARWGRSELRNDVPFAAEAQQAWEQAERIVRDAAACIRADAERRPGLAGDAAWAATDALAVAAYGIEGDAGGPLTGASDSFDRAGRASGRRTPEANGTGVALRAAARTMALLARSNRPDAARAAAVTLALSSLVAAVTALREAQQRLHQMESAHVAAEHLQRASALVTTPRNRSAARHAVVALAGTPALVRPPDAVGASANMPDPFGPRRMLARRSLGA